MKGLKIKIQYALKSEIALDCLFKAYKNTKNTSHNV